MPRTSGAGDDWRAILRAHDPVLAIGPVTLVAVHLLVNLGRVEAACEACRELVAREPRSRSALLEFARLLGRVGQAEEAVGARAQAIAIEVESRGLAGERQTLEFCLAAEGLADRPAAAPAGYVASLFNGYAEQYDDHLIDALSYRGPQLLHAAVLPFLATDARNLRVLDIGCGTGLAGACWRPLASRLDGIDLSPAMLAKARIRGIYDELAAGELCSLLPGCDRRYDLVVAADVLCYFGDLGPPLRAIRSVLCAGALLAFTLELSATEGFALQPARRYAHHRSHVRETARAQGYALPRMRKAIVRHEGGRPVESLVVVLRRPD